MAKRAKESSSTGKPATTMIAPITRNPEKPSNAGAKLQRVIRHGTYTASVPGAMTRKMADPIMAVILCTQHLAHGRPGVFRGTPGTGRQLALGQDKVKSFLTTEDPPRRACSTKDTEEKAGHPPPPDL